MIKFYLVTTKDCFYGKFKQEINILYKYTGEGDLTIEYKLKSESDDCYKPAIPSEVGDYTVEIISSETNNYNVEKVTADFSIKKANYDLSNIIFGDVIYSYDGSLKSVTILGDLPENVKVYYDNNSNKNAGTYVITANFINTDSQHDIKPLKMNLTKKPLDLTNV